MNISGIEIESRYEGKGYAQRHHYPETYLGLANPTNIKKFNEIVDQLEDRFGYHCDNFFSKHSSGYYVESRNIGYKIYVRMRKCKFSIRIGARLSEEDTGISGTDSMKKFITECRKHHIDLSKYYKAEECKPLNVGAIVESYIEPNVVYDNVHHLDLNSAFLSGIITKYPEFKPVLEEWYNKRKTNEEYKLIINSFIGALQSDVCRYYRNLRKKEPYSLNILSRAAREYCNNTIRRLQKELIDSGRKIININTDGIWYQGDIYHSNEEGHNLCQYKNDHSNCQFISPYLEREHKTSTNYQFLEGDKLDMSFRGVCNLDLIKHREDWKWKEICDTKPLQIKLDKDTNKIIYKGE